MSRDLQIALRDRGFDPGPIDGKIGPKTLAAMMQAVKAIPVKAWPDVPENQGRLLGVEKLEGVHPDLVLVVKAAASKAPFPIRITEGLRTVERQKQLVATGASQTMNSRHLTGHAIDVVPVFDVNHDGKVSSEELYHWPLYYQLAPIMKEAAAELGVEVKWGGDWTSFKDGPHWELDRNFYA